MNMHENVRTRSVASVAATAAAPAFGAGTAAAALAAPTPAAPFDVSTPTAVAVGRHLSTILGVDVNLGSAT